MLLAVEPRSALAWGSACLGSRQLEVGEARLPATPGALTATIEGVEVLLGAGLQLRLVFDQVEGRVGTERRYRDPLPPALRAWHGLPPAGATEVRVVALPGRLADLGIVPVLLGIDDLGRLPAGGAEER